MSSSSQRLLLPSVVMSATLPFATCGCPTFFFYWFILSLSRWVCDVECRDFLNLCRLPRFPPILPSRTLRCNNIVVHMIVCVAHIAYILKEGSEPHVHRIIEVFLCYTIRRAMKTYFNILVGDNIDIRSIRPLFRLYEILTFFFTRRINKVSMT